MTDAELRSAVRAMVLTLRAQVRAELIAEAERVVFGSDWIKAAKKPKRKQVAKDRAARGSRSARIFQALTQHQWLSSTEIANAIGSNGHETCRLLRRLHGEGRLERRGERKRYEYAIQAQAAE